MDHTIDNSMHQDVPAATLDSFEIEDISDLDTNAPNFYCNSCLSCIMCITSQ